MIGYARLNDPIAYGDSDDSDEVLRERAHENLSIDGMDDKWLDIEVREVGDGEAKAAYLYTLVEDSEDNPAEDRITNDAQDGNIYGLEGGPGCTLDDYWEHLEGSWSVEGVAYNGD